MKEKYGYTFHGKYFNLFKKYFHIVWNMERKCETRNIAKKMFWNNQWKQKKKRNNFKTRVSVLFVAINFFMLKVVKVKCFRYYDIQSVEAISYTFAMLSLQYFYTYSTHVVMWLNFLFSNEISYFILKNYLITNIYHHKLNRVVANHLFKNYREKHLHPPYTQWTHEAKRSFIQKQRHASMIISKVRAKQKRGCTGEP